MLIGPSSQDKWGKLPSVLGNLHIHYSFRTPIKQLLAEAVVITTLLQDQQETLFLTAMQLTELISVCWSCLYHPKAVCAILIEKYDALGVGLERLILFLLQLQVSQWKWFLLL